MALEAQERLSVLLDWEHAPQLRIQLCQRLLTPGLLPRTSMDQPALQTGTLPVQVRSVCCQRVVTDHFIHYFMAAAQHPDLVRVCKEIC